jgi:hypothetical protein
MKQLITLSFLVGVMAFTSCKKEEDAVIAPSYDYSKIDTTNYSVNFKNAAGDTTTDRSTGRTYLNLFIGLRNYIGTSTSLNVALDSTILKNMFANTGNEYPDTTEYLNTSGLQIKSTSASSLTVVEADKVRKDLERFLVNLAKSSDSVSYTAVSGKSGLVITGSKKYLVDSKGIEWGQVVQKALIGAYQLDYIGNVLLANSDANNTTIIANTKYTQLAQNWDKAYGALTLNNIYGKNAIAASSGETQLGAYAWEYNLNNPKSNKAVNDINRAFLKGRTAVAYNDITTVKSQADVIRMTFEKSLAKAALAYLGKWKTAGATNAEKAHALGEGLGFIYALRFCKLSGADVAFSDSVFNSLITVGYWNMTNDLIVAAETNIKSKFGL